MTRMDIIVSVLCLIAGYWGVSRFINRKPADEPREPQASPPPSFAGNTPEVSEPVTGSNWYRILGVPEYATKDEIVAAYRTLISKYHPDKVAQMGEEIRAVAEAKSMQLNAAYEMGMSFFK